jgi:hypothetical protein
MTNDAQEISSKGSKILEDTYQTIHAMACVGIISFKISLKVNEGHNLMLPFTRNIRIRKNNLEKHIIYKCQY